MLPCALKNKNRKKLSKAQITISMLLISSTMAFLPPPTTPPPLLPTTPPPLLPTTPPPLLPATPPPLPPPTSSSSHDFLERIIFALKQKCLENENHTYLPKVFEGKAAFYSVESHPFTLEDYISSTVEALSLSETIYILAFIYIDRVSEKEPLFKLTRFNVHRLFLTCVMLADKFANDVNFSNKFYAEVGGLENTKEMNFLETQLLEILQFELNVDSCCFKDYSVAFGFHNDHEI